LHLLVCPAVRRDICSPPLPSAAFSPREELGKALHILESVFAIVPNVREDDIAAMWVESDIVIETVVLVIHVLDFVAVFFHTKLA
jgi:hypothetical protein